MQAGRCNHSCSTLQWLHTNPTTEPAQSPNQPACSLLYCRQRWVFVNMDACMASQAVTFTVIAKLKVSGFPALAPCRAQRLPCVACLGLFSYPRVPTAVPVHGSDVC